MRWRAFPLRTTAHHHASPRTTKVLTWSSAHSAHGIRARYFSVLVSKHRKANHHKVCRAKRHWCQCMSRRHQDGIEPVATFSLWQHCTWEFLVTRGLGAGAGTYTQDHKNTQARIVTSSERRPRGITTRREDKHNDSRQGEKTNTRIHGDERRPARRFATSSRRHDDHEESRPGERATSSTKYQESARKRNQEGDRHGSRPPEVPRRRLPPTSRTTENAMKRRLQRKGGNRHEDDGIGQGRHRRSMKVCPEGCS